MSKFRSQKNLVVCRSLGVALHIFIDIQIRQFINLR